jgi:hypothetical protein
MAISAKTSVPKICFLISGLFNTGLSPKVELPLTKLSVISTGLNKRGIFFSVAF